MVLKDKLDYLIAKGWTYNKENGEIVSNLGKIIKSHLCGMKIDGKSMSVTKNSFAFYYTYGKIETTYHIDGNKNNNKLSNLSVNKNKNLKNSVCVEEINKSVLVVSDKPKYVNDTELRYEIIISMGKGKLTPKAEKMLIKISSQLIKKFNYNGNQDFKYDCQMSGLMSMLLNWNNYNYERYDSAFPYFSEICKRGMAKGLNLLRHKGYGVDTKFISLSNSFNI